MVRAVLLILSYMVPIYGGWRIAAGIYIVAAAEDEDDIIGGFIEVISGVVMVFLPSLTALALCW